MAAAARPSYTDKYFLIRKDDTMADDDKMKKVDNAMQQQGVDPDRVDPAQKKEIAEDMPDSE